MADRSTWDAQFGTGLRSEYDFTIYSATFGTDLSYMNGQTFLLILSGVDEDGTESTEMLSLGEGWESRDGGFTVVHERKAIINKQSVYGKWCAFAADAMDNVGNKYLYDKSPTEAAIWNDTIWHMEEREVGEAFTDRKTGKEVAARTRLMPVAFLGFAKDAKDSPVAGSQAAPPASVADRRAELAARASAASQVAAAPPTNGTSPSSPSADPTIDQLAALARDNDLQTFLSLALAMDQVVTDERLAEQVIDSGPSGFYATHH